jgi:hypothetical protein
MNHLEQFTENKPSEILYSCDEFTIHKELNTKTLRFKKSYGRFLPYVVKNGVIEAILLPKESDGMATYETESINQLNDVIEHCNKFGWEVNEDNFIHLGFWRISQFIDSSECVWGLDIESCQNSNSILSDDNFVVLPISALLNIGDAISGASALKLLLKVSKDS